MSANRFRTTLRTTWAQDLITDAGAGSKLKGYTGALPAGVAPVGGGNTLLCTAVFAGAACGVATGGAVDWDEAGASQTPAGFAAGTPTFFDITTSADVVVGRFELNVTDGWTWSGAIAVGQPFSLTSLVSTMPGAT